MRGLKSFRSAAATLAGIELMHVIRKGQLLPTGEMRRILSEFAPGKCSLRSDVRPRSIRRLRLLVVARVPVEGKTSQRHSAVARSPSRV